MKANGKEQKVEKAAEPLPKKTKRNLDPNGQSFAFVVVLHELCSYALFGKGVGNTRPYKYQQLILWKQRVEKSATQQRDVMGLL